MMSYETLLKRKEIVAPSVGVSIDPAHLHSRTFPFQRDITIWSLRKGRAANFAATGMGKTLMQLDWARNTGASVLIVTPLGVARQTVAEAHKFDINAVYSRSSDQLHPITVTNYEMLDHFDPAAFGAVVLDESSILKSFEGKTRTKLIKQFRDVPLRLCCSATPAPNDIAELANHAEFLGLLTRAEMLAAFFVHDDQGWRLKGHAREPFFRWLASWAFCLTTPSDLGYSDDGYVLPPLSIQAVVVPSGYVPDGQLFFTGLKGIGDRVKVRKATVDARVARAAAQIRAEPDEQWLVWCGLNDEGRKLARALPGATLIEGSDSPDSKANALEAFATGRLRLLITKTTIAGFGMNFQSCARVLFLGLNDSWEQYFQAIRRCWRFGQERDVRVYVVISDIEESVYENVLRKDAEARAMTSELMSHVAEFERAEIRQIAHMDYRPTREMELPAWLSSASSTPIELADIGANGRGYAT